jgi:hypothetical protein
LSDRRRPQLELALRHLHDIREPSPKAQTLRNAKRGEAAGEWVDCGTCGGSGTVTRFRRQEPCTDCSQVCPTCDGSRLDRRGKACTKCATADGAPCGRVWARGHKGQVHIDQYTRKRIGSAASGLTSKAPVRMVRCDACDGEKVHGNGEVCGYCGGEGKRPLHAFNLAIDTREQDAILDHVQRQVDQRAKDRSWVELETAMARLKREKWNSWRLVHRVYVIRVLSVEDVYGRTGAGLSYETLENGMQYLLWRLPEDWTAPAGLRANEKLLRDRRTRARGRGQEVGRRDKEIREHARAGRSPQWIAAEYGLSVRTVYEVVNGKREESAA